MVIGMCLREKMLPAMFLKMPSAVAPAPVAKSKFSGKRIKEMGSNNNNKKNNLLQMDPEV